MYLTDKQENKIYAEIVKRFEAKFGESTNVESRFVFDVYNYFTIHTEDDVYTVDFETLNCKLVIKSIKYKKL